MQGDCLLEVRADEVDELFTELGGHGAGADVKADVVLKDLGHQAVDAAFDSGEKHQDVSTVLVLLQAALNGLHLALNALGTVDELGTFAIDLQGGLRFNEYFIPYRGILHRMN